MKGMHITSASLYISETERQALTKALKGREKGEHTVTTATHRYTGRLKTIGTQREFDVETRTKVQPAKAEKAPSANTPATAAPKKGAAKKAAPKKPGGASEK